MEALPLPDLLEYQQCFTPKDDYAFTVQGFNRSIEQLPDDALTPRLVREPPDNEEMVLEDRITRVLDNPFRSYLTDTPIGPTRHTEASKRAMLWQAQAIAMSSDRPNSLILNRMDKLTSYMMNHQEVLWEFINDDALVNKLLTQWDAPVCYSANERLTIREALMQYRAYMTRWVDHNRHRLSGLELNISQSLIMDNQDEADDAGLLMQRTIFCASSQINQYGLGCCGEIVGSFLEQKLLRAHPYPFIPIHCEVLFHDVKPVYSSNPPECLRLYYQDHVFIMLLHPDDYKTACMKRWLNENKCRLTSPVKTYIPKSQEDESKEFAALLREREAQAGIGQRTAVRLKKIRKSVSTKIRSAFTRSEIPDSTPIPVYDEPKAPKLIQQTFAVVADPWLQNWQTLNDSNWKNFLRTIAKECGLESFKGYAINFIQVF